MPTVTFYLRGPSRTFLTDDHEIACSCNWKGRKSGREAVHLDHEQLTGEKCDEWGHPEKHVKEKKVQGPIGAIGPAPTRDQEIMDQQDRSPALLVVKWPESRHRREVRLGPLIEHIEKLEREMARIEAAERAFFDGRKPTRWQEKHREKRQERLEEIKKELGGLLRRPAG